MPHYCEIDPDCDANGNLGERRDCGHYACDGCTDEATNFCLSCVPVDDIEYNDLCARREAFLAGLADRADDDYDVDDAAAESYFENACRQVEADHD